MSPWAFAVKGDPNEYNIAGVDGISKSVAQKIYDHFHSRP